ncbi:DUF7521 family protein [Halorarum halobium]|uniref:DUF7521 family protein n=1 Tax=Halorarum halobium TaxID=3075121 RepID=UPI0028AECF85|nr:hypothetical protein [Halobaculum sp. XH14]
MVRSPELWAFILANVGLFLVGSTLALLSYLAYRRNRGRRSYRLSTIGFGFVVFGGLVEPVYQLSARGDYVLTRDELLLLQSGETLLMAVGLGILFYSITTHGTDADSTITSRTHAGTEYTLEAGYRDES